MDTITIASDNYAIVAAPEATVTVVDVGGVVAVPQPETVVVSVGEVGPPGDTSAFGTMAVQDADDVAITGGSISVPIVTATTEFRGTTITSNSTNPIDTKTSGGTQFRVGHVASAINWVQASGGLSGAPSIFSAGADTDVSFSLASKGAGSLAFYTNNFAQQQFRVDHTASAVNYLRTTGAVAAGRVRFGPNGDDTNIGANLSSKGTGDLLFTTNSFSQLQMSVVHAANAVNYLNVTGGASGVNAGVYAAGSGADAGISTSTQGAGAMFFYTNAFAAPQFAITHTASSVNYGTVSGGPVGNSIWFAAAGNDAAVQFGLASKSTSPVIFRTNGVSGSTQFAVTHTANAVNYLAPGGGATTQSAFMLATGSDSNVSMWLSTKGTERIAMSPGGVEQFTVVNTASSVNKLNVSGGPVASSPYLSAAGNDTDVGITFSTKGAGGFGVYSHAGAALQAWFPGTASAVNYARITGGTTGNPPSVTGTGANTDVDLSLLTKGTGVLRFGTHSALAAEALSGYITIKDSGGTTRKLAVIS